MEFWSLLIIIIIVMMSTKDKFIFIFNIWSCFFQKSSFLFWLEHRIILVFILCFNIIENKVLTLNLLFRKQFINRSQSLSILLLIISFLRELSLSCLILIRHWQTHGLEHLPHHKLRDFILWHSILLKTTIK